MQIMKLSDLTMFGVSTCSIKINPNTPNQKLSKRPMECREREGEKAGKIFDLKPWDIMAHT